MRSTRRTNSRRISSRRANYHWGVALGIAAALLVALGLWVALKVNRPAAQHDSLRAQEALVLKRHAGNPITVALASGRAQFFPAAGRRTVSPALKQAAADALRQLPQSARGRTVIVAAAQAPAPLGLANLTVHIESLYTQGKRVHQRRLVKHLTTTATGELARIRDVVASDEARRAVNYAAQTHQAETHALTPTQLNKLMQKPLLASLSATNFKLAQDALLITEAGGKPAASVPYAKIAPYLKGATAQPPAGKLIALTFDDGPNAATTPGILKTLAAAQVKATFFEVGTGIAALPALAKRVKAAGHEVGTHTFDHPYLPKLASAKAWDELYGNNLWTYYHVFGTLPPFIRPPYGAMSKANADLIGMPAIQWSVDSQDWKSKSKPAIIARIQATARPGGIVLMHDIQPAEVQALPVVIANLKRQGYQFVTVSQLLGQQLLPGHQYFGQGDERLIG